jgi:hypothetical protein
MRQNSNHLTNNDMSEHTRTQLQTLLLANIYCKQRTDAHLTHSAAAIFIGAAAAIIEWFMCECNVCV